MKSTVFAPVFSLSNARSDALVSPNDLYYTFGLFNILLLDFSWTSFINAWSESPPSPRQMKNECWSQYTIIFQKLQLGQLHFKHIMRTGFPPVHCPDKSTVAFVSQQEHYQFTYTWNIVWTPLSLVTKHQLLYERNVRHRIIPSFRSPQFHKITKKLLQWRITRESDQRYHERISIESSNTPATANSILNVSLPRCSPILLI